MKSAMVVLLLASFCLPASAFQDSSAATATEQPKLTPEEVQAIKAKRERALKINALITQANNALAAKQWQELLPILRELIATDPNRWEFYEGLGDTQFRLADYAAAAQSYEKGVEIALKDPTVNAQDASTDPEKKKTGMAHMLINEGNAYVKLKNFAAAIVAYKRAAEFDPRPAIAWFNVCATQYNTGDVEGALESCEKSIAFDPTRADAYFIKGSLLLAESKTDAAGKLQPPAGTEGALRKYLELAPQGPHAGDVRAMLNAIGSKIETTYQKKN